MIATFFCTKKTKQKTNKNKKQKTRTLEKKQGRLEFETGPLYQPVSAGNRSPDFLSCQCPPIKAWHMPRATLLSNTDVLDSHFLGCRDPFKQCGDNGSPIILLSFLIYLQINSPCLSKFGLNFTLKISLQFYISQLFDFDTHGAVRNVPIFFSISSSFPFLLLFCFVLFLFFKRFY